MAGLKKPSRKKDSSSPSLALIIFLVIFVLLSIGLGVWGYYGYAGQEKLAADAKTAKTKETVQKEEKDYEQMVALEGMQAIGLQLTPDQLTTLTGLRDALQGGKFDKMGTVEMVKKYVAENKAKLGFDAQKYTKTYKDEFDRLEKTLVEKEATIVAKDQEIQKANAQFKLLQDGQDKHHASIVKDIAKGSDEALKASRDGAARFADLQTLIKKISDERDQAKRDIDSTKASLERIIRERNEQIAKLSTQKMEVVSATRNANDVHALLLDVSRGKPLWDRPLGKIVRSDMGQRQVIINLGSASGVQPEATFCIFGAGPYGGAEKHLKGTIEVTRILDANTAQARITSLYDADGLEILLNDTGLSRIRRESESALREGDLLFNMFWGSSVAIAGPVSLTTGYTDSPAEQMRRLSDFAYFLERQGMPVDAYLDLTDGTIKGAIGPQTRYLIITPELRTDGKDAQAERAKALNEALQAMKKDAIEKGMFIISVDNFLNIVGYRIPRSATTSEYAGFRPSQPKAGLALPLRLQPVRPREEPEIAPEPGANPANPEDKKGPAMDKEKEEKKKDEEK